MPVFCCAYRGSSSCSKSQIRSSLRSTHAMTSAAVDTGIHQSSASFPLPPARFGWRFETTKIENFLRGFFRLTTRSIPSLPAAQGSPSRMSIDWTKYFPLNPIMFFGISFMSTPFRCAVTRLRESRSPERSRRRA